MTAVFSFDRYEGHIAVLLTDSGKQVNFPKELLPKDAKPGCMLSIDMKVDWKATETLKKNTAALQNELRQTDTGEDIKL